MNSVIQQLQTSFAGVAISLATLPENHSLNDMLVNYGIGSISELINDKKPALSQTVVFGNVMQPEALKLTITEDQSEPKLELICEGKLVYKSPLGNYYILGNLPTDLGNLKVAIHFEEASSKRKHRHKPDLYDRSHVVNLSKSIAELENMNRELVEADLLQLTDLLEQYRDKQLQIDSLMSNKTRNSNLLPPEKEREAMEFLMSDNLLNKIDDLIETSGIVGESSNRKMLFVISSTYKMLNPLHALVQGTSGSGKSHLINSIAGLMPPEDVLNMTRVTSKSFYHYKQDELINKLLIIQDFDGLDEEAQYAFREMQSAGYVTSSTIQKNKQGNLESVLKPVKTHFASMVATTQAEVYYDNMSRSIVMGVDESDEQTLTIIKHQNRQTAGLIDSVAEQKAKELLQNCVRVLKAYPVVNKYADKVQLPVEAKMLRRLNSHYQSFVAQITLLHQFQRQKDEQGRLIATVEDLKLACEVLFDAIMWKIDELDSSLRQFFEQLKTFINKQQQKDQYRFSAREIRQEFNLSKTQMHRYLEELKELEYIQVAEGSANRGFRYRITYWDNMVQLRQKVKMDLMGQLNQL